MRLKSILALGFLCLCSCNLYQSESSYLEDLKEHDLVLITRNSLSTYFFDRAEQWRGFEYDLIKEFSKDHDLKLKIKLVPSTQEGFEELQQNRYSVLAAGLALTEDRKKKFRYSNPYHLIRQEVVCHRFGKKASTRKDLKNIDLTVVEDSSYELSLKRLQEIMPEIQWQTTVENSEQALYHVYRKESDCTVVDSHILALQQRLYPELQATFALSPLEGLHWYVNKKDYHLQRLLNRWIDEHQSKVQEIRERYFGAIAEDFDYYDNKVFERRIRSRLPRWKKQFQRIAKKYDMDWRLLAALSYQESHWNNAAVSPTGVRGLMMLTQRTAKELGVSNRLDPKQSIDGGTRYFLKIKTLIN